MTTSPDTLYASVAQTKALLKQSLPARTARLQAADMVSTAEAAELAGVSRITIAKWISTGRCIGLTQLKRGFRLPNWQFEPAVWDVLPALTAALGTPEGWAVLSFLESPQAGLEGRTPRAALEQGQAERVLALAREA